MADQVSTPSEPRAEASKGQGTGARAAQLIWRIVVVAAGVAWDCALLLVYGYKLVSRDHAQWINRNRRRLHTSRQVPPKPKKPKLKYLRLP